MVQSGADADLLNVHLGNRVLFTENIFLLTSIPYVCIKIFHDKHSRSNSMLHYYVENETQNIQQLDTYCIYPLWFA
jgi:hypothetical protein